MIKYMCNDNNDVIYVCNDIRGEEGDLKRGLVREGGWGRTRAGMCTGTGTGTGEGQGEKQGEGGCRCRRLVEVRKPVKVGERRCGHAGRGRWRRVEGEKGRWAEREIKGDGQNEVQGDG
jgi:hypothetical protein